jgi:AcrR family transcriptional regulator
VDALVEATARLLIQDGYDRTSTNRIAALAGVSIGSLYQYFPSKEALVAAVAQRHAEDLSRVVMAAFLGAAESPIDVGIRALVMAGIAAHSVDPALHRILAEEAPRIGVLGDIDALQRNGRSLIRGYLEAHRDEIDVADPDLAAFMLVTTVEALTHAAVLHRPDVLAGAKAGQFADEVTGLVLRYLRGGAS